MVLTDARGCGEGKTMVLKHAQVPCLLGGLLEGISRPHSLTLTFAFLTRSRWDSGDGCGSTFEVSVSVKDFIGKFFETC